MNRWFRFYNDALRNPKVASLSDRDFRTWVALLAAANENSGVIPSKDALKHLLMMRLDHLSSALDRLARIGLIDTLGDCYEPHNWSKFQYKSDTSTDRVTLHRQRKSVSDETPPDTDTDTDTEVVENKSLLQRARRASRLKPDWIPSSDYPGPVAVLIQQWPDGRLARELDQFRDYWVAQAGKSAAKHDWDRTWHNRIRDQHSRVVREAAWFKKSDEDAWLC